MTALALVVSFWPSNQLPGWKILTWDKLIHAGLFFVLTIAWSRTGIPVARVVAVAVALILVTEIGQSVLPIGRHGDPFDALADLLGMAAALRLRSFARGPTAPTLKEN